jgi:hypothetical protein
MGDRSSVTLGFGNLAELLAVLRQLAPSCAVGRYGRSRGFWLGAPVPGASGASPRPNPAGFGIGRAR